MLKALYIEDSANDISLLKRILDGSLIDCNLDYARNLENGILSLQKQYYDVCLVDLSLPDALGLEAVEKVHALSQNSAIVVVTGNASESAAIEALRKGAHDYLVKGEFDSATLGRCIRYSMERRQNERNLKEALKLAKEAEASKEFFIATLSHEIRSSLGSASLITSLLQMDSGLSKYAEKLDQLGGCVAMMAAILNNVLDLSKIQAGKIDLNVEPYDFREMVRQVMDVVVAKAESKGICLKLEIDPEIPSRLIGDELRVKQILINLLNNAIKFTEKGHVNLVIDFVENAYSPTLKFRIIDTGIGMSDDGIQRLFKPYSQASAAVAKAHGGTGLGLLISQSLLKCMGGDIFAQSKLGQGSTFEIRLPIVVASNFVPQENFREVGVRARKTGSQLKILVGEDSPISRKNLIAHLEQWGHSCQGAGAGEDVVEMLTKDNFDILILDCNMPGLDGIQTTKLIRSCRDQYYHDIPIIALTGDGFERNRDQCIDAGMDHFLTKPLDINRLLEILSEYDAVPRKIHNPPPQEEDYFGSIDLNLFRRLDAASNKMLSKELAEMFIDSAPEAVEKIGNALKSGQMEKVLFILHNLKSEALGLGAKKFQQNCIDMEKGLFSKNDILVSKQFSIVENSLAQALSDLSVLVERPLLYKGH